MLSLNRLATVLANQGNPAMTIEQISARFNNFSPSEIRQIIAEKPEEFVLQTVNESLILSLKHPEKYAAKVLPKKQAGERK